MILAHSIALDPTFKQERYFRQASGVARFAYNYALAEWKRQYEAGEKPSAYAIKAKWNSIRREQFPWSTEVTKCSGSQAIMNLGVAFGNFFRGLKSGKRVGYPKFHKKGINDSFAIWNDQFVVRANSIRLPHIGWVKMRESLRFEGKILGAVVKRKAGRWFVSIQVELPDTMEGHAHPGTTVGIDLGITTLMTLSKPIGDSYAIPNPKAVRVFKKRQSRLQRRISRKELIRRKTNAKRSNRQSKRQACLQRLHYRISCIRKDAIHKATTSIANTFESIALEDLNVAGMVKNQNLSASIHDAAFGEIRRQFEYKAVMRGGRVIFAGRFFPSSKTCSACGCIVAKLPLSIRAWTCCECGTTHDRDRNAAKNLEKVGQAMPEPLETATHGEIGALVVLQDTTKLPSMSRELNRCVYAHTN